MLELENGDYFIIEKLGGDKGIRKVQEIMRSEPNNAIEVDRAITSIRNAYALVYNRPWIGSPRMMVAEKNSNLWARKREVFLPEDVQDIDYEEALKQIEAIINKVNKWHI